MEERQTQIREGAGLEESKLNVEFIDWLRKWSTPIMGLIALVALGFVIAGKVEKSRAAAVDRAFQEYADASEQNNPNPETLKTVASEHAGVKAVSLMAEMKAADLYLRSARLGVKVGARLGADGSAPVEELATEEQRTGYLADAEKLYQKVLDATSANSKKAVHALGAAYGLAAVAECRGNIEAAKQAYERVVKIAEYSGLEPQALVAKKRIENLPKLAAAPKLLSNADLPKPPEPPKPAISEGGAAPSTLAPGEPAPGTPNVTPPAAPSGAPTGTPAAPPADPKPEAPKTEDPKAPQPK